MNDIALALNGLSSAEEFLEFLEVEYEQRVVNINRLHILKRFNQYLARHAFTGSSAAELKREYRELLTCAYRDFVESDAATEKVFKVFREAQGVKTFNVESLRASVPGRR